jgi:Caspase domain
MVLGIAQAAVAADEPPTAAPVPAAEGTARERRVALVIGNSAFANYGALKNPANDAEDMARRLRELGFDVIERKDLDSRQIGATLRDFRVRLEGATIGLVFLAGHGLQINGENYFPGVDAKIESEDDVPNQSLALRQLLDLLGDAKTQLNLLFIDACRNNPFALRTRSGTRGLARVDAPSGTLISYATRPGSVASDGTGRNGLYTSQLLAQMTEAPNLPIEFVLKRVVSGVKQGSNGRQDPWWEGSIEGNFCFAACGESATAAAPVPVVRTEHPAQAALTSNSPPTKPARTGAAQHSAAAAAPAAVERPSRTVQVSLPNLEPLYFTRAFSRTETGSIFRLDGTQAAAWHTRTTPGNGGIFSIAVSPSGELYFCDATEARIFKLDGEHESVVYQHATPIKHLAFGPSGRLYFSSVMGSQTDATIYELVGPKAVPFYTLKADSIAGGWSGTFAFDRQGMLWLSSGSRRPASLYRVRYQQLEKIFSTDQTAIMGFLFLSDGGIAFADNAHSVMHLTLPSLQLSRIFDSPYEGWLTDVKSAQLEKK